MKKRFTLLIAITGLLLGGSSGKVWGQGGANGYWGDGCGCNTLTFSINTHDHDGISIDGHRYEYWFSGVQTATTTVPAATVTLTNVSGNITTNNPGSGIYRSGGHFVNYYYTGVVTASNTCGPSNCVPPLYTSCCPGYNSYLYTRVDNPIYYPPINDCGYNTSVLVPWIHTDTDPVHAHSPINVGVSGGTIYTPNHYAHLDFFDPHYEHRQYAYSTATGSAGSWTSSYGVTQQGYVQNGTIALAGGTSVRLHGAPNAILFSPTGGSLGTTHQLTLPANFYMRFDAKYAGPNGVTLSPANGLTTVNDPNKGLGFFNGTALAVTVNNGYLFLGSSTNDQQYTVASNAPVFIENYYRAADQADNSVNLHDLSINFNAFALAGFPLYVSNSNPCYQIIFHTNFSPSGITGTGGIHIGVNGAGTGVTRGGGITRFRQPVSFTSVTADINIFGGDVIFESPATYTYGGTTGLHRMFAHAECSTTNGDILFQGGTVSVTKSDGNTNWQAARNIVTSPGSTVNYAISNVSNTNWNAGNDILTNDNVTFTLSTSGTTNWLAGRNITSTACTNTILFNHTGTGPTYWEATLGSISVAPVVTFTKTNASNGYTQWLAGQNINTSNNVSFTSLNNTTAGPTHGTKWQAGNDINVIDRCQPTTIAFTNNSATDDYMWWYAGQNVKVAGAYNGPITVNFKNDAANLPTTYNYMKWEAVGMDINIDTADINFSTTKTGDAKWWAGRDININLSDIDFSNTGAANGTGYTEWFAQKNILMYHSLVDFAHDGPGDTKWHARDVNIEADNTPITFKNDGKGYTWWLAGNDILLHDQSPVKFTDAATTNYLKLEAGRDIRTGLNSPLLIDHKSPNPVGLPAHITAWAGRNIWTESSVDILNDGIQNQTYLYAGQDIRIDSTLTFTATNIAGVDWVRMRANTGDIIVNTQPTDIQSMHPDPIGFNPLNGVCDARRAAVNFTLLGTTSAGSTQWWAGKNIISNDTIHFHYDNTANTVQDLWLHADMENIDLRRIMKVDFDSDSLIRWEALTQNAPARRQNKHSLNPTGCYNGTQHVNIGQYGNIRTSDSVIINRTYAGLVAGKTQIDAYNDIQTAMFDYTSANTIGDLTDITSRMGDIWLGYSWQNPAHCTSDNLDSPVNFDLNRFIYRVPATAGGQLNIKAGYDDKVDNANKYDGGNIYFTHIVDLLGKTGTYNTEISIPFSNMFICGVNGNALGGCDYERAGIIGGVARCQITATSPLQCKDTGLIHMGNNGQLLVDAGTRGNIIINNGSYLNFQSDNGNTEFRTRWGDIDMRYPFDVDSVKGSLLYLASSDLPNKLKTAVCGCDEKRNNIYLQDFKYNPIVNSGSIFVGADNNIKLQYGGLKDIGTERDPFLSTNIGYPCGRQYHCDSDTSENLARDLILNFAKTKGGSAITSGGFAAVASDLIDVYKQMIYTGGQGSGMSSVPKYGSLHGESVAGYGLYIKTQANKSNWGKNAFDLLNVNACWPPKCDDPCVLSNSILQNVARVTFHSDARIYTENQRTYIGSPVLETYGNLDLNTHNNKGGKTAITIQTDSLIVHDSLIIDGKLTKFTTWSNLYRDMPVIKLGHQRFTPPFVEDGSICAPCFIHQKGTGTYAKRTALDTLYVTYRNGASMPRLHTLIADHTVLSFLTDSLDHVKGDPTLNAKFYTDTFKIRNHVELYTDKKHERDGHFELISEAQMTSKDYAGIYARHLHMEPVAPACATDFSYSQLWLPDPALDVITTSTFGGYGWIHADVHVEIEATLAPGYASLREKGDYCRELKAGTLKMQDLRLDKGAELRYSIGHEEGFNGEKVDCIEVDEITMYGSVFINVEKRCGQKFEEGCYPIIRYNSVAIDTVNLNNLKLNTKKIDGYRLALDTSIPGIVYLCIGDVDLPSITRAIQIPQTAGVTTNPAYGIHYVASQDNFKFTAKYTTAQPLKVVTDRLVNGKEEELAGRLNANGEYEYVIRKVTQNIVLKFGPDFATDNIVIDGRAVWSHNNTIYVRVEAEDIASIYSIAGQLVKRIELPEGSTPIPMERGVYVVTLKDGSVHKVIVK